MSPEQFEQNGQVGVASDVWALSVVAFECLVGRVPFAGQSVPALIKAICHDPAPTPSSLGAPRAFDAWFAKGTALEPARRFASVKEAAVQLRRALGVTESAALGAAPLPKTAPTARVNEGALSPGTAAPLSVSNASVAPRVKVALAVAVVVLGSIGVSAWLVAARGGSGAPELARELETSRPSASLTGAPPSVTPLPSQGSPIPSASAVPSASASATAPSEARVPRAQPQPPRSGSNRREREEAPSPPPDFIDAPPPRRTPSPRTSAPPRDDKAPLFL
jgi:serine/threonine-protein kinase